MAAYGSLMWWREQNNDYVLLDDNGDIYAEITLPNTYTLLDRETIIDAMSQATGTKWSEATEYVYEG